MKSLDRDDINGGIYEELKGLVGTEAANCLVNRYAGSSLYIPKRVASELQ